MCVICIIQLEGQALVSLCLSTKKYSWLKMESVYIILIFLIFQPIFCNKNKFPDDFLFGVASSAYQIEGGANHRGATSLDHHLSLNPSMVADSSNAQIACDSYHRYQEDISLVKNLGVDFYRFSIAWSRILPTGYPNRINPDGIRYYNNLIDGLLSNNIQPMITMVHYDLPKPIQDLGGWVNPVVAELFEDYARILFQNFGDRVKYWITMNSFWTGYGDAQFPPMLNQSGIGEYLCGKTMVLAHAKVYHLYNNEFRDGQKGQIGFTTDGRWFEPASRHDSDAAERAREFLFGILTNPIFGSGDFPEIVKKRVEELSLKEGFWKSRLPKFSPEEQKFVKGAYDFLGLNMYTTFLVKDEPGMDQREAYSLDKDIGGKLYQDSHWSGAASPWLKIVPWGLRNVLKWVKEKYNNPPIFITENGFSDSGELEDLGRINYYQLYLRAVLEAIHEDGVQVKGYAAWSLLDNFEWLAGYSEKFGLHHVDFSDPNRKRTPKASAKWYKKLIERRELDTLRTEL